MINRYVALDIETTGLNPAVDRIIEVGMARIENDCITEKYSTLVYPGISISERITGLTGIHNDDLTKVLLEQLSHYNLPVLYIADTLADHQKSSLFQQIPHY